MLHVSRKGYDLPCLAPDIVEMILDGRQPRSWAAPSIQAVLSGRMAGAARGFF